jgi:hypothetical protein
VAALKAFSASLRLSRMGPRAMRAYITAGGARNRLQ